MDKVKVTKGEREREKEFFKMIRLNNNNKGSTVF